MHMPMDTTFAVPLPKSPSAFTSLAAAPTATVNIRVVPSRGQSGPAPALKAVSVGTL
jgi:hypothetical protein